MDNHSDKKRVLAFDFDGTLTTHDTMMSFARYVFGTLRLTLTLTLISPLLVLMKLRLYPNWKAKQAFFSLLFKGMAVEKYHSLCKDFADAHRHVLRPQGLQAISKALDEHADVVIVSASMVDWVRPFFIDMRVKVIGTEAETKNGILTGRLATANCYGSEKVRRLTALYPDRTAYTLTAYGDSRGDRELLAFADEAHYKPFGN